jgi:hypothetical protein
MKAAAILMLGALAFSGIGCSSDAGEDDEVEDEVVDTSTEAIISTVNCTTTRQSAYDAGRQYGIDVITIGGKRASKPTGHAFLKMQQAAHSAGVHLVINSGFRTMSEQQYFWGCYQNGNCNNGNLAARPGYSNHQNGRALDLTTSTWLANNASRFGFKRTVPSEAWHYEYTRGTDPGGPCTGGGGSTTPDPAPTTPAPSTPAPSTPPPSGGAACSSDGQCNPGNDGSGLICQASQCVAGCRSNAHCPGSTTCVSGQCN